MLDLVKARYALGRSEASDGLPIDFVFGADPSVSRHQCNLRADGDTYVLENVSAQGTQVNRRLHTSSVVLHPGDDIWLGDATRLRFDVLHDVGRDQDMEREFFASAKPTTPEASGHAPASRSSRLVSALIAFWVVVFSVVFALREDETTAPSAAAEEATLATWFEHLAGDYRPDDLGRVRTSEEGHAVLARGRERFDAASPETPYGRWFRIRDGLVVLWRLGHDRAAAATLSEHAAIRSFAETLRQDADALDSSLDEARRDALDALDTGDAPRGRRALRRIVDALLPWQSNHPLRRWAEGVLRDLR